ncbi:hypothetical protein SAMN05421823_102527 [Catalinimonas alkaloidigena]|uniref:Uncharacterized protein n=1 Tax=Catalinimonas alkaloidigena TaxID=1075417 RepID=A0A1G9B6A0_9BACT|nr:hypothetical protein [Catalinimonas alkaloidigena]SDK35076.1 hypothetical protein SAMN05421823_102527 [Catalinimonas alkaloidigena]
MILLRDALRQMEQLDERKEPVPFNLVFYTKDGERVELRQVVLSRKVKALPRHQRQVGSAAKPSHRQRARINVLIPQSEQIRSVHTRLIVEFNSQDVAW